MARIFNPELESSSEEMADALKKLIKKEPVILCLGKGSDIISSFGPLVGSLLIDNKTSYKVIGNYRDIFTIDDCDDGRIDALKKIKEEFPEKHLVILGYSTSCKAKHEGQIKLDQMTNRSSKDRSLVEYTQVEYMHSSNEKPKHSFGFKHVYMASFCVYKALKSLDT